jgi:hypothetical protein
MIRLLSIAFLAAFAIAACTGKNKIPKGILSRPKMEAVLWDLISADEFVSGYILPQNPSIDRKKESFKLYDQVFRMDKTSSDEFRKSLSFYQSHPYLLKDILDSINSNHETLSFQHSRIILYDSIKLQNKAVQ